VGRWTDKYVIGLTGNIAMGKSLVRQMLQHLGAYPLDADGLAHQVMAPNAPAYKPVVETFGRFVLTPQGQIDRNKLGAVAFSHAEALQALERITHPIISAAIDTLISRAKHKVIVVEAIKLLETDLIGYVDAIWVVDCSPQLQLQRLMKRGLSQAEAIKRIQVQNPQTDKLARANVVINNNGTPEEVWGQVQKAWSTLAQGKADSAAAEQVRTVQVKTQTGTAQAVGAGAGQRMAISSLAIKRPRPHDFDKLVKVINIVTKRNTTRGDIMAAFGEKSYLMAEANDQAVGVIAFLVENLVTRVDEFIIHPQVSLSSVGKPLIEAMEKASHDLQSEIAFVFLPTQATDKKRVFMDAGYEEVKVEEIRIPAWREAVTDSRPPETVVLSKRLREKLILKPI